MYNIVCDLALAMVLPWIRILMIQVASDNGNWIRSIYCNTIFDQHRLHTFYTCDFVKTGMSYNKANTLNSLRPSDAYKHQSDDIIGSDNGLWPNGCQAIAWTNYDLF